MKIIILIIIIYILGLNDAIYNKEGIDEEKKKIIMKLLKNFMKN